MRSITLKSVVLVGLVLALLSLWVGPFVDHHFAERVPHVHINALDNVTSHLHAYEVPHRHDLQVSDAAGQEGPVSGTALRPSPTELALIASAMLVLWTTGLVLPARTSRLVPLRLPLLTLGASAPARAERPPTV